MKPSWITSFGQRRINRQWKAETYRQNQQVKENRGSLKKTVGIVYYLLKQVFPIKAIMSSVLSNNSFIELIHKLSMVNS